MANVKAQRQVFMVRVRGLPVAEEGDGLVGVFQHAIGLHLQADHDLLARFPLQPGQPGSELAQLLLGTLL